MGFWMFLLPVRWGSADITTRGNVRKNRGTEMSEGLPNAKKWSGNIILSLSRPGPLQQLPDSDLLTQGQEPLDTCKSWDFCR